MNNRLAPDPTTEAFNALRQGVEGEGEDVRISRTHAGVLLEYEPEAPSVDRDYSARDGYDPSFLKDFGVPLPTLAEDHLADAATPDGTSDPELRYHHFSVIMSTSRRLARLTAANVDGRRHFAIDREKDRWIVDERVPDSQVGNAIYDGNPYDRGHLVRRLDPAWGDRIDIAVAAINDTFHFTNCAPQHEGFNRNPKTWHGVEDFLLSLADCDNLRLTVFTGPVLDPDDPPISGIDDPSLQSFQVPRKFWKVVAVPRSKELLWVTAFLLSQDDLIGVEEVIPEHLKEFQVPVSEIERLTHLSFGILAERDTLAGEVSTTEGTWRELDSFDDIILPSDSAA